MNFKMYQLTISALTLLSLVSCGIFPNRTTESNRPRVSSNSSDNDDREGSLITDRAAEELNAYNFVEVRYNPASAVLTQNAKTSLNDAVVQARRNGNIDQVIVLSWSDEEYPSRQSKKLPMAQRILADKRNTSVEEYFENYKSIDVDTYNMAERPNTISKWFNTTNSRLKRSLVAAGLPTTADTSGYTGKAARSVVLLKVE